MVFKERSSEPKDFPHCNRVILHHEGEKVLHEGINIRRRGRWGLVGKKCRRSVSLGISCLACTPTSMQLQASLKAAWPTGFIFPCSQPLISLFCCPTSFISLPSITSNGAILCSAISFIQLWLFSDGECAVTLPPSATNQKVHCSILFILSLPVDLKRFLCNSLLLYSGFHLSVQCVISQLIDSLHIRRSQPRWPRSNLNMYKALRRV